ncbi:MAG TPA: glutathione S-transferase family protein [Pseudomonadales bacterium]|nr:glutathione S-transferase family protein [Pseudomonadales bacterium]
MSTELTLYDFLPSGNGYKVRLLLSHLQRPYQLKEINILQGESRTAEFLQLNPNGRIPVIDDSGFVLAESNAILWYLAENTPYFPRQKPLQAKILQWMFFEQYSHEPFIATSRFWISCLQQKEKYRAQLEQKKPGGLAALSIMDKHLATQEFFVGNRYSIADIALYAYTHVAEEGEFPLQDYPHILAWLKRVEAMPGYVSLNSFLQAN